MLYLYISLAFTFVVRIVPNCDSSRVKGPPLAANFCKNGKKQEVVTYNGGQGYTMNRAQCTPMQRDLITHLAINKRNEIIINKIKEKLLAPKNRTVKAAVVTGGTVNTGGATYVKDNSVGNSIGSGKTVLVSNGNMSGANSGGSMYVASATNNSGNMAPVSGNAHIVTPAMNIQQQSTPSIISSKGIASQGSNSIGYVVNSMPKSNEIVRQERKILQPKIIEAKTMANTQQVMMPVVSRPVIINQTQRQPVAIQGTDQRQEMQPQQAIQRAVPVEAQPVAVRSVQKSAPMVRQSVIFKPVQNVVPIIRQPVMVRPVKNVVPMVRQPVMVRAVKNIVPVIRQPVIAEPVKNIVPVISRPIMIKPVQKVVPISKQPIIVKSIQGSAAPINNETPIKIVNPPKTIPSTSRMLPAQQVIVDQGSNTGPEYGNFITGYAIQYSANGTGNLVYTSQDEQNLNLSSGIDNGNYQTQGTIADCDTGNYASCANNGISQQSQDYTPSNVNTVQSPSGYYNNDCTEYSPDNQACANKIIVVPNIERIPQQIIQKTPIIIPVQSKQASIRPENMVNDLSRKFSNIVVLPVYDGNYINTVSSQLRPYNTPENFFSIKDLCIMNAINHSSLCDEYNNIKSARLVIHGTPKIVLPKQNISTVIERGGISDNDLIKFAQGLNLLEIRKIKRNISAIIKILSNITNSSAGSGYPVNLGSGQHRGMCILNSPLAGTGVVNDNDLVCARIVCKDKKCLTSFDNAKLVINDNDNSNVQVKPQIYSGGNQNYAVDDGAMNQGSSNAIQPKSQVYPGDNQSYAANDGSMDQGTVGDTQPVVSQAPEQITSSGNGVEVANVQEQSYLTNCQDDNTCNIGECIGDNCLQDNTISIKQNQGGVKSNISLPGELLNKNLTIKSEISINNGNVSGSEGTVILSDVLGNNPPNFSANGQGTSNDSNLSNEDTGGQEASANEHIIIDKGEADSKQVLDNGANAGANAGADFDFNGGSGGVGFNEYPEAKSNNASISLDTPSTLKGGYADGFDNGGLRGEGSLNSGSLSYSEDVSGSDDQKLSVILKYLLKIQRNKLSNDLGEDFEDYTLKDFDKLDLCNGIEEKIYCDKLYTLMFNKFGRSSSRNKLKSNVRSFLNRYDRFSSKKIDDMILEALMLHMNEYKPSHEVEINAEDSSTDDNLFLKHKSKGLDLSNTSGDFVDKVHVVRMSDIMSGNNIEECSYLLQKYGTSSSKYCSSKCAIYYARCDDESPSITYLSKLL